MEQRLSLSPFHTEIQRVEHVFVFGCAGSSLLLLGFLQVQWVGGYCCSWFMGFSRVRASPAVAHGLSCPVARGMVPDQGSNPRLPHWQVDAYPLQHQGSSRNSIKKKKILVHLDYLPRFLLFLHWLKWKLIKSMLQLPLRSEGTFEKQHLEEVSVLSWSLWHYPQ